MTPGSNFSPDANCSSPRVCGELGCNRDCKDVIVVAEGVQMAKAVFDTLADGGRHPADKTTRNRDRTNYATWRCPTHGELATDPVNPRCLVCAAEAPTATLLPTDPHARKNAPIARGFLDYFPRAVAAVAELSYAATQQHHPDKSMHWDKSKSTDHADCIVRHLIERGTVDTDGKRHAAKVAWRAMALLETELENAA